MTRYYLLCADRRSGQTLRFVPSPMVVDRPPRAAGSQSYGARVRVVGCGLQSSVEWMSLLAFPQPRALTAYICIMYVIEQLGRGLGVQPNSEVNVCMAL